MKRQQNTQKHADTFARQNEHRNLSGLGLGAGGSGAAPSRQDPHLEKRPRRTARAARPNQTSGISLSEVTGGCPGRRSTKERGRAGAGDAGGEDRHGSPDHTEEVPRLTVGAPWA